MVDLENPNLEMDDDQGYPHDETETSILIKSRVFVRVPIVGCPLVLTARSVNLEGSPMRCRIFETFRSKQLRLKSEKGKSGKGILFRQSV